jgi:trans-aconitate methyltransferase
MTAATNQTWNPDQYSRNARFVSELGLPVVEMLAPRAGERILDLGCGVGPLTKKLADLGCQVVGVDASQEMITAAQSLGLNAYVMNGHALQYENEFDAVFTNAALHWMKQPDKVIAGVWKALKPGGRFVGEFGGHGNVATIVAALESMLVKRGIDAKPLNPWYFPDVDEYNDRLQECGFTVKTIMLVPRPTPLPGHLVGWLETFAKSFTAALPASEHIQYLEEAAAMCRTNLSNTDGSWTADYVRLRFIAVKP